MLDRNALPRPSPCEAPLTRPAISTRSKLAGIIFFEFTISLSFFNLLSGRGTFPTFGSIVQKGKFSAGIEDLVKALKRVDLPTFGSPTIPHLNPILFRM
jgi:hypothetical protein